MTDLRDYDRDALLIEKVRGLERRLANAHDSLDIAYAKGREDGRADGKHQIEQLRKALDIAYDKGYDTGRAKFAADLAAGKMQAEMLRIIHIPPSVPEKRPIDGDYSKEDFYKEGWNDCIDEMLAAAPKPGDE